jgi:hypothetical protein
MLDESTADSLIGVVIVVSVVALVGMLVTIFRSERQLTRRWVAILLVCVVAFVALLFSVPYTPGPD